MHPHCSYFTDFYSYKNLLNWIRDKSRFLHQVFWAFPYSVLPAYTLDFCEAMIINTIISSSSLGHFVLKWRRKELDEHLAARSALGMPESSTGRHHGVGVCRERERLWTSSHWSSLLWGDPNAGGNCFRELRSLWREAWKILKSQTQIPADFQKKAKNEVQR